MGISVIIDILILSICLIFCIRGLFRGFVYEIMSLLAFVAGYFAVIMFKDNVMLFLQNKFNLSELVSLVLASMGLFVLAYFLIKFLEVQISRFVHLIMLSSLNRVTGALVGIVEGGVLVLFIVYIIRIQMIFPSLAQNLELDKSTLLSYLERMWSVLLNV